MRRGLLILAILLGMNAAAAFGAGGVFVVDGVPQRHVGLASQAYVDAHVPALSVAASNAMRLIQIDTQAWVTVTGGTATLWQVATSTQLVCSGAGTLAVNGLYEGSVAGGYFENTTNADMTVIGEEDSWFVYDRSGGGWLYHCFGSESPVGGVWLADSGAAPAPTLSWGESVTTNAYPLARITDVTNLCAAAQLACSANLLAQSVRMYSPFLVVNMNEPLVYDQDGQNLHFEVQWSTHADFSNPVSYNSGTSQANWRYFNGSEFAELPASGISAFDYDSSHLACVVFSPTNVLNQEVFIRARSWDGVDWSDYVTGYGSGTVRLGN